MMTAKGKLQRIKAADINVIGRNTQGVRIMNVDEGDNLIAVVRVPAEEESEEGAGSENTTDAAEQSATNAAADAASAEAAAPSDDSAPENEENSQD